jgi:hypothetical protein
MLAKPPTAPAVHEDPATLTTGWKSPEYPCKSFTFQEVFVALEAGEYGPCRDRPPIGYFSTQEGAKIAAKGKGWWGGEGIVRPQMVIRMVFPDDRVVILEVSASPEIAGAIVLGKSPIVIDDAVERRVAQRTKAQEALKAAGFSADDIKAAGL